MINKLRKKQQLESMVTHEHEINQKGGVLWDEIGLNIEK